MNTITVDIHEKNEQIITDLDALGLTVVREALNSGDYVFETYNNKSVGIERKSAKDFLNTVSAQRFLDQVQKLVDTYDIPYVLIAGRVSCSKRNRARVGQREWALPYKFVVTQFTAASDLGAQLIQIDSDDHSGMVLAQIHSWYQEEEHESFHSQPRSKLPRGPEGDKIKVLMSLPGVGIGTAKKVLEEYGTPSAFLKEIESTTLIGEATRERILSVLG